jgi:hypothetical protein
MGNQDEGGSWGKYVMKILVTLWLSLMVSFWNIFLNMWIIIYTTKSVLWVGLILIPSCICMTGYSSLTHWTSCPPPPPPHSSVGLGFVFFNFSFSHSERAGVCKGKIRWKRN